MTTDQKTPQNFAMVIPSLLITGFMTFMLCSSGFFSILSPLPLVHSSLRYGKLSSYVLAALTFGVASYFLPAEQGKVALTILLGVYLTIALIIIEIFHLGIKPLKGLVIGSALVISIIGVGSYAYLSSENQTAEEFFTAKIIENSKNYTQMVGLFYEKESIEYKSLVQKIEKEPETFSSEILVILPKVVIVLIIITFWINLCLGFKTRFMPIEKKQNLQELIQVKVPEHLIWVFIAGLALVVGEEYLEIGTGFSNFGSYLLTVLAVFYFFQGFGVYVSFLDNLKVTGFFRSLLIVSTVYIASQVLILIGLSDMFVNYRRFFTKNNNEGEL